MVSAPESAAVTPGQADEPEIPVHLVQLWLCDPCLDGEGEECHTPGCSLWIHDVPKPGLRSSQGVTILGPALEPFMTREQFAARQPAPGQADPWQVITDVMSELLRGGQTAGIRCRAALSVLDAAGIDFDGNPVALAARQPQPAPDCRRALLDIIDVVSRLDEPGPEADHIRLLAEYGLGEAGHPDDDPQPAPELAEDDDPRDVPIVRTRKPEIRTTAQPAPELAAAMAEARQYRDIYRNEASRLIAERDEARGQLGALRDRLAAYESAVTWETSCLSCARVLDSAYAETVRRETAEDALDEVGVMAANAPEDDAFAVCEQIAMRVAAHGVPVEGP